MIVTKKIFELSEMTTISGKTIKKVRIGWESYGELNADKSNAILICHYFAGTSHAAGKYAESDPLPGYWDAIIGPGRAIDTNKYFVFSSDTLVNINAYDPNVVTTGPASIDAATGKPYGLSFPLVTFGDFVHVQKALVESLGIKKFARRGGTVGGRAADLRMGRDLPGHDGADHAGDRPRQSRRLAHRLAQRLGDAGASRRQLAQWRLL
jgi:homoserine O-acetyltransferase